MNPLSLFHSHSLYHCATHGNLGAALFQLYTRLLSKRFVVNSEHKIETVRVVLSEQFVNYERCSLNRLLNLASAPTLHSPHIHETFVEALIDSLHVFETHLLTEYLLVERLDEES